MIKFDVSGNVSVLGESSNTPTTTVRQHTIRAIHDGTLLGRIDKLTLVDSGGTERDSTTTLSYSIVGGSLQISGNISVTADYTIAAIRSYKGADAYFTTSVTPTSVRSGDTVVATLTITFSMSGSMSGYSFVMDLARDTVYDILRGTKTASALRVDTVRVYMYNVDTRTTTWYNLTPTKTIAPDGLSVSYSVSLTPDFNWETRNIEIYASGARLWYWSVSTPAAGSAGTAITFTETVSA